MLQKTKQQDIWENEEVLQGQINENKNQKRVHLHNQTYYDCNSVDSSLFLEGGQRQDANSKPKNGMVQQQNQDFTRNSLQYAPNQQIIDPSQQYQEKPKSKNEQSGFSGRNKNQQLMSGERSSSTQNNQNLDNKILDSGNMHQNKQQNQNIIKNSKNRKLYTSIGAYNNMSSGMNQGNKSILESNISSMSGLNNMNTFNQVQKNNGNTINNANEMISFSGQNTSNNNKIKSSLINNDQIFAVVNGTTGANSLYNALAQTNVGKFGNLQQRNLIISQQQSLKNKVKLQAFDIDSQGASEQYKQIQKGVKSQLDSSQNIHKEFVQQQQLLNQQNQNFKKQEFIQSGATNKQKNKSFNEKQSDINIKANSNKFQSDIIREINQHNQNLFSMDPQQRKIDLIQNINQNQIHAYKSMLQDDPLENTTDLSVLSAGNKTFIINQSNNQTNQAISTQNGRNSNIQENKNRNGISSNKKLKNLKDIQQITHNSVIIQRNSSNSKQNNVLVNSNAQKNQRGSSLQSKVVQKNAKRNTITTQNIDQQQLLLDYNNFQNIQQTQSNQFNTNQNKDQTHFGNFIIDQRSKEYLENSFQSNPNVSNFINLNNQYSGEGVPSMPLQKNSFSNNRVTSKMMTIGSSQKQNQAEEYSQQNAQQEEIQPGQDQSQQYQNIKQRPHSSFKAQTQKQIHLYKQQQVQKQNGGVVMIPKQDVQLNLQEKIADIFQDNVRENSVSYNQNTNITSGQNSGLINFTSNQKVIDQQNKNLSGRKSLIHNQQLLIGPDGVIGIAPSQFNSNFANGSKTVGGQRKNKKLNQQVSINKVGDLVLSNTLNQKANQISVYQNQIVSDVNYRQPRRVGRGGSGAVNSGIAVRNDFNSTAHENREMRTSSAGPGISNTEFRYLNFTGNMSGKQNSGNVIFNNFNLQNQNQNYMNGGGDMSVASAQITEGIIKAGNTVTIPSYKKDSIFIPQIKNNTQLLTSNQHNQKNSAVSLIMSQKQISDVQNNRNVQSNNKSSKRNVANGTLSSGDYLKKGNELQNMKIDQILSSTNKSMINQKKINQDQLAIFQNIDTIRSGDGYIGRFNNQFMNHESPIYNEVLQSQSLNEAKNKIKSQINHNSLILQEQHQKIQANSNPRKYREEGSKVKSNSKESRVSMRNSVISGNGVQSNGGATPHERDISSHIMQQANKTHQQSMQKFLQQQMSMYYQAPLSNNTNQIFNPIQNSGTRINTTLSQQHQQLKKKVHLQNGQVIRQQNSSQITNVNFLSNNQQPQGYQGQGNIVIQGSQGQVIQGQGSGQNKIRQSAQKLQKKQMKDFINLSASERLKGMQIQKDISRKSGTQTAIGIGGGSISQAQKVTTVLNSNQIQFQKQINQSKIQSQSLSRSRINSQNKQKLLQQANGIIIERQSMQNDGDRNLMKNGDSMQKQIIGQKENLPGSVTPELLNNQRIQLINGSNFGNQRNFYTQINNTKNQIDEYQIDLKSSTSAQEDNNIQIIQNNLQQHIQQKKQNQQNKKPYLNDQMKQEINSPTGHRNNQTELSLLRLQNYQLEMAKQAIREMRLALNKNKQDSSKESQLQKQRPKSQNDVNTNIKIQVESGAREDSQNDAYFNDQIFEFEGDSSANIQKNQNKRNDNSSKSKLDNNQFLVIESNPSQDESINKKYQDQSQTQNKDDYFENQNANEKEDEIDKEQFLQIVSKTFDKIIQQLHSGIRDPLAQMKLMYQHYIQQIEQNNSFELSTLAIQMQEMQNTITHLNSENLQLKLQINQPLQNKGQNQTQKQKDEIEKQIKNLNKQLDEAQIYKQKYENLKVEVQKQNEFKRENIGKSAIEDMKNNLQQQKNEKNKQIKKNNQLDQAFRLNEDEFLDDSSLDNLIQGIPQQNLEKILFNKNNQSNQILQDGPNIDKKQKKQNDLSIKIIDNFQKEQKRDIGFVNEFERDESQMSSIPLYENDRQLKLKQQNERNSLIQQQLTMENDIEMEFDENNEDYPSDSKRRRIMENDIDNDESQSNLNQSYFSSRIHSSSETINSEVIAAYQEAIQNNSNLVFEDSQSPNKIKNSNKKNKKVKETMKIPALDFEKIQEQYELDMQQEELMNQQQNQEEQQSNPETGKMSNYVEDDSSQDLQEMQELIGKIMNQEQQNKQININKSLFNQKINLQAFQNQDKGKNIKIQGGLGLAIDLNQVKKENGSQNINLGKNKNDYQLNLNKIEAKNQNNENDFQDEFMAKYDEFSESWRMMIQKQKRF